MNQKNTMLKREEPDQWQGLPMTQSSQSIITDGKLLYAYARKTWKPNEVEFKGVGDAPINNDDCIVDFGVAMSATAPEDTEKGDYKDLLERGWTGDPGSHVITLRNLKEGGKYLVQIIAFQPQGDYPTATQMSPDMQAVIRFGGDGWEHGGTLIGIFTAKGNVQVFVFPYEVHAYINAIQVREFGDPGGGGGGPGAGGGGGPRGGIPDYSSPDTGDDWNPNFADSNVHYQTGNEAVDIDRYLKHMVKGYLPPMNWWDMLPDWPAISYTSIIMDQTRAAKKYILDGLPSTDDIGFELESRKYPYRSMATDVLIKGKVDPGTTDVVLGHEILQMEMDKDTVKDTDPIIGTIPMAFMTTTTQTNAKYFPIAPIFKFPEVYRDDLTDQKNPALDLFDTQKLVDEFLAIGQRVYDSQTENPTIFGFDEINSKYEKDKNIVLANYKQYKANVRRMEYINNIIETNNAHYLTENITYRHDIPNCSNAEEYTTRYLREKLLAWYNETMDPETKVWSQYHWLPGEPGRVEELLTVGDYEWYDNLIAGLEDSVARLEDLEATIDLLASMATALGTIEKYATSIEEMEIEVEDPDWQSTVTFTNEVIDHTMLKELLGVSAVKGVIEGELTPIRAELEGLRMANLGILEEVRFMAPTFMAFPIIWTRLFTLAIQVLFDIDMHLNVLILDLLGDYETLGKHSSPSHIPLDIVEQMMDIVDKVMADTINIIDQQALLPKSGLHRLDSMLNKINEIRKWGPMCAIPWHYWMAIDNVNAAERYYNDIWSDVFDCWEREYITRVWKVVTEHHLSGVIPPVNYGKPLFSAECPHHLPMLLAPVPVAYRDVPINYLSANCRKHFNFFASWLTSVLYAIGVKRTALGAVITDTSLNGDDANLEWLSELNTLTFKNNILKKEIDRIISNYNGSGPLLSKSDLDKVIAAKELSPVHYSNQVLLNMSSQVHLLNTFPVTTFDVATNENRTGTLVSDSPPLMWKSVAVPQNSIEQADIPPEIDVLKVNTIPTVGGPAEIVIDTAVIADQTSIAKGFYVGDVSEFEPWYYMQPDWETQRALPEIPIVVPPETAPVMPDPQEIIMPEVAPDPAQAFLEFPRSEESRDPVNKETLDKVNKGRITIKGVNMDESAQLKAKSMDGLLKSIVEGLVNKNPVTGKNNNDENK